MTKRKDDDEDSGRSLQSETRAYKDVSLGVEQKSRGFIFPSTFLQTPLSQMLQYVHGVTDNDTACVFAACTQDNERVQHGTFSTFQRTRVSQFKPSDLRPAPNRGELFPVRGDDDEVSETLPVLTFDFSSCSCCSISSTLPDYSRPYNNFVVVVVID